MFSAWPLSQVHTVNLQHDRTPGPQPGKRFQVPNSGSPGALAPGSPPDLLECSLDGAGVGAEPLPRGPTQPGSLHSSRFPGPAGSRAQCEDHCFSGKIPESLQGGRVKSPPPPSKPCRLHTSSGRCCVLHPYLHIFTITCSGQQMLNQF